MWCLNTTGHICWTQCLILQVSWLGLRWFLFNGTICIADGTHQRSSWISRHLPRWVKSKCIFVIVSCMTCFAYFRYLDQCQIVLHFKNGPGNPVMATRKNHGIVHNPGMLRNIVMLSIYPVIPLRRPIRPELRDTLYKSFRIRLLGLFTNTMIHRIVYLFALASYPTRQE